MPQVISLNQLQQFLSTTDPFDRMSQESLQWLASRCQLLQYRVGQPLLTREHLPVQVAIVFQGQVRLLGYGSVNNIPLSLTTLGPGGVVGAISLIRGTPCEVVTASEETIAIVLPAADFLELLGKESALRAAFLERPFLSELFELLVADLERRADASTDPKALAQRLLANDDVKIANMPQGKFASDRLDRDFTWLVSSGTVTDHPVGSRLNLSFTEFTVENHTGARLLGFRDLTATNGVLESATGAIAPLSAAEIPFAPDRPAAPTAEDSYETTRRLPYVRGRGPRDGLIACLQMLGRHQEVSFKRDMVERVVDNQLKKTGKISMQVCGALVEMIGLSGQLVQVPVAALPRVKGPALIPWQDSFAVIYSISPSEIVMASPESGGVVRRKLETFLESTDNPLMLLLVRKREGDRAEKFGLHSFIPYIKQHSSVLIEVLVSSFFILLFSLANPLIVQIIIDKVLLQNAIDTLDILGWLLVMVAAFEALLTALRTYLFTDTTNRIDLALGSEIIDHLLRLPLSYFDRRRVGDLATRINELENIRRFMTGTALTVVLDAVFSVIYIGVMLLYSWLLTVVALITVPFFILLAVIASPIIRRQLRVKAERNADTQSYLVEVTSGIQTVKAQNIELKSRWTWQEKYARYVNAGFQTVLTSSWAGSLSNFLNKLSSLLLIWVGAHLVLKGDITLGQLIGFRIIASYVTSPLLRLAQLWQSFEEIGLSIERLSDIVDTPQEVDETDRNNIPMPDINGTIRFEEVSFRFGATGPLQLSNINLEIPAGSFVGIVGQSGSGKSTLTKLIQRLYDPLSGRVQIDNYDIGKVELYSLRRQIGTVLQDTLLFNGTVQENISLTNPEATAEEIVEAARIAAAHDFIMDLPNGYNTQVGERGAGLSGGQRQRIAIARTVLQRPRLLILDEATSALDYDSERQVCNNLAEAFHDRTVLFITHRLNTIKRADIILMMDKGAIVEQGTHAELMAMRGRYFALFQQQEAQM